MVKNNQIAIVVPSFNEVKNLSILIVGINKKLKGSRIIIVDDSSIKENLKLQSIVKKYKNVFLISRSKKLGRGSAVLEGFRHALKNKSTKYIFEMDSDLAHDPKEMTRFIKNEEKTKADLIIGSRYLPGGKIINIPSNRTIMSRVINQFLYFWLGIHISDHTSGFRLYSKAAVKYLLSVNIKSKGFITLSEIAYKLYLAGYKISEVPITWNYRIYGKSNVNSSELVRSLIFIVRMRFDK